MSTTVTLGALNLNDRVSYRTLPGADLGEQPLSFDAFRSYSGSVAQANVSTTDIVRMSIPLLIIGTSRADLDAKVAAINTILAAPPTTFVYNDGVGYSYTVVHSPQVRAIRTVEYQSAFLARIDLALNRLP